MIGVSSPLIAKISHIAENPRARFFLPYFLFFLLFFLSREKFSFFFEEKGLENLAQGKYASRAINAFTRRESGIVLNAGKCPSRVLGYIRIIMVGGEHVSTYFVGHLAYYSIHAIRGEMLYIHLLIIQSTPLGASSETPVSRALDHYPLGVMGGHHAIEHRIASSLTHGFSSRRR